MLVSKTFYSVFNPKFNKQEITKIINEGLDLNKFRGRWWEGIEDLAERFLGGSAVNKQFIKDYEIDIYNRIDPNKKTKLRFSLISTSSFVDDSNYWNMLIDMTPVNTCVKISKEFIVKKENSFSEKDFQIHYLIQKAKTYCNSFQKTYNYIGNELIK